MGLGLAVRKPIRQSVECNNEPKLNTNYLTTMSNNTLNQKKALAKAGVILLGIDVHAEKQVVVRQIDGGTPQPGQRFSRAGLLNWAKKQLALSREVYSCYEAGPFGYGLHRQLEAIGVKNLVVRPRDWDDYGKKVKTDKRDARALTEALDRYVRGNKRALAVVRVPTEKEEQQRSASRQREAFSRELQRLAAMGRSHSLYYGERLKGQWWKPRRWKQLEKELPSIVLKLLAPLRRLILAVEEELGEATAAIQAQADTVRPKGLGALSAELIAREIGDYYRFSNRRQVASYTGLCPSEHSSGNHRFQGSVTKHGNPRLRRLLVEAVWRLLCFQPKYIRLEKWWAQLHRHRGKLSSAWKKKMVVAIARQFMIDLWRINTGRCSCEDLGLESAK
jgi:transposase